jgi:hypothetical protein
MSSRVHVPVGDIIVVKELTLAIPAGKASVLMEGSCAGLWYAGLEGDSR